MSGSKVILAWAVGSMRPARQGAQGYCASVWAVSRDGGATFIAVEPKVSKQPNRDEWRAVLRAVVGVLEEVEPGSAVVIRVVQDRVPKNYDAGWSDKHCKPYRDADVAAEIFKLRDDKRLAISLVRHKIDAEYERLRESATAAAVRRNAELSAEERHAVSPMPGARPSFPAVEPGEGDF